MAIVVRCGQCGKDLRVPDDAAGKRGKCPSCGTLIQIPAPSDEVTEIEVSVEPIVVQCGKCGKSLRVPADSVGKRGKCPSCGTLIQIPSMGVKTPEPPPSKVVRGQTRLIGFRKKMQEKEKRGKVATGRVAKGGAVVSRRKTTRGGIKAGRKGLSEKATKKRRKFEYDPEKAARRKKRQLIIMCIIGAALLVTGITYHIVFVSPVKKRVGEFKRLLDNASNLLDAYYEQVKRIKVIELPETPSLIEKVSNTMKAYHKEFETTLKNSKIYEVVGGYRLFKLLAELPKIPEEMIQVLNKVKEVEKEAREDEWSEERLVKRKYDLHTKFIDGYHKLKVKLRTALMYLNAMERALRVRNRSEEDWREWLEQRYREAFGGAR